jgi:hypothetical protein
VLGGEVTKDDLRCTRVVRQLTYADSLDWHADLKHYEVNNCVRAKSTYILVSLGFLTYLLFVTVIWEGNNNLCLCDYIILSYKGHSSP